MIHDDRSLLALQGPAAHETLQPLLKDLDLNKFYFSNFALLDIAGIPCWLTRTGSVADTILLSHVDFFHFTVERMISHLLMLPLSSASARCVGTDTFGACTGTLARMDLKSQCQTATRWSWRRSCWRMRE